MLSFTSQIRVLSNHLYIHTWHRTRPVFFAIASVVSAVSMWLKVKTFVEQLRERRSTIFDETEEQTGHQRKLKAHEKKLVKTNRQINLLYSSMMIGAAECIPLGILQSTRHGILYAYMGGYLRNSIGVVIVWGSCLLPACLAKYVAWCFARTVS